MEEVGFVLARALVVGSHWQLPVNVVAVLLLLPVGSGTWTASCIGPCRSSATAAVDAAAAAGGGYAERSLWTWRGC